MREEIRENNQYYTIVGGSFRVQVDKDDPKAVRRDWTSADGTKSGTKYERIVNALVGYIEDIQFRDSDYGLQRYIALDKSADGSMPVIALSTASREAETFSRNCRISASSKRSVCAHSISRGMAARCVAWRSHRKIRKESLQSKSQTTSAMQH